MQRVFSISIPQELFNKLEEQSKATGVPRSKIAANALWVVFGGKEDMQNGA